MNAREYLESVSTYNGAIPQFESTRRSKRMPERTEARDDGGGHVAVFLIPELDESSSVDFRASFDLKFTRDRGADKAVVASDASYGSVPDELRVEAVLDITELSLADDELRECRNGAKTWCG